MINSSNELEANCPKIAVSAARSHLIESFRELNLYSDDPFWSPTLRNSEQILSTRLFLLLISVSLLIVIIYSSLRIVNHDKTLHEFSINDFEQYEKFYPNTINALCNEVSIPYNKFLSLSPVLHEVCLSEFIGDKWISSLFLFNATSHNILDYRTFGFAHYRALKLLCNISRQTIKDIHRTFNSTNLNNRNILSRIQFNELSSVLFNNLQQNILTNEKRTGNLISMITAGNDLLSALRTNYFIQSVPGTRKYVSYSGFYYQQSRTENSICACRSKENQCVYPAGAFYSWTLPELDKPAKNDPPPLFQIPGLMAGCLPLDAMRQSTLECLYNQTCVNMISLQPNISQPKALNLSLTRFSLNSTIGSIFDESLFVESWHNKSNFENYFAACAPQSLSYSYQAPFHFPTIFSLTVNAFGGLVIVWKLITPILIKIWNRIKGKNQLSSTVEQTSIELEIMKMTPKKINTVVKCHVKRTIHNFNLFPSKSKNNFEEEHIGIITTRLYIFLILISLIILGFHTCVSKHNGIKIIENPSLSKFEKLNSKYSSTLNCPCSRFSMSYGRIMSLSPRYHSICSSEYLQDYWLSYFGRIEIEPNANFFLSTDFRASGQSFFSLIKILCKTSNETIENAINIFKTNRLVTMNTLSYKQFYIETQKHLKSFQQQTISSFIHLIQLIRTAIQTNQLAEEASTNIGPKSFFNNETNSWSMRYQLRDIYTNSCSCALSNECTRPVGFHLEENANHTQPNITIPGLVLGCFMIDSVLLSTLECFYDRTCIKLLIDNYDFQVVGLVSPLDNRARQIQPLSNNNSRFLPNTTINELFSQLFVEDSHNSTNFTSYYSRCQPSQCTFTQRKHFDIAFMLAFMLGFCGALVVILEIILPPIVKLFMRQWIKHNKRTQTDHVTTQDPTVNTESSCKENIFKRLLSLNFFVSDPPSIEDQYKNQEIIATRIYILLFVISIIATLIYYGPISKETKLKKIKNPSIDQIADLYKQNLSSLSCPCSKVAIRYSSFLSIQYERHPICSTEFASPLYQSNLFIKNESNITLQLVTHYRILSTFCYLSNEFIKNADEAFDNQELITIEPLTNLTFNIQTESLIFNFIRQTKFEYRRKFLFIIKSFSVNQLLNLFENNWKIGFTNETENYLIKTTPHRFSSSNCSCAISSSCNEQLIGDIRIGCFPFDGFRFSKYKNISYETLNYQLFVKKWINQTNYTNYFQTCQPLECQYTLPDKNNPLFMLTTLLGLYGGLTFSLRLIVGRSLLAYRWWTKRNR